MNASLKPVQTSAEAERAARVDLAACYRLADRFGLNEGIDNHLTMLLPGHDDRFLLAPFGLHWSEVKAGDFMVVDFNGRILSGRGPVEPTALYIHAPVHRLAPQARCVLHTHMPYATALTMLENPRLEMAVQSALGFCEDIAYDNDYNGLAFAASEGERMARALGNLISRREVKKAVAAIIFGADVLTGRDRLFPCLGGAHVVDHCGHDAMLSRPPSSVAE